jgi:hypothetical protein
MQNIRLPSPAPAAGTHEVLKGVQHGGGSTHLSNGFTGTRAGGKMGKGRSVMTQQAATIPEVQMPITAPQQHHHYNNNSNQCQHAPDATSSKCTGCHATPCTSRVCPCQLFSSFLVCLMSHTRTV